MVTKTLAEEWKKKTKKEKEDFTVKAAEEALRKKAESDRGENVLDITEDDNRMPRITICVFCGKVCLGEQFLMAHLIAEHSAESDEDLTLEVHDEILLVEDTEILTIDELGPENEIEAEDLTNVEA